MSASSMPESPSNPPSSPENGCEDMTHGCEENMIIVQGQQGQEELIAEKILAGIYNKSLNKNFYKVQWKGMSRNTWEAEEDLGEYQDLIWSYGRIVKNKRNAKKADLEEEEVIIIDESSQSEPETDQLTGFARGLEAERILGGTELDGEMCFVIKWAGTDIKDVVPRKEANLKCPQVVIRFYEEQIEWFDHTRETFKQMYGLDLYSSEKGTDGDDENEESEEDRSGEEDESGGDSWEDEESEGYSGEEEESELDIEEDEEWVEVVIGEKEVHSPEETET